MSAMAGGNAAAAAAMVGGSGSGQPDMGKTLSALGMDENEFKTMMLKRLLLPTCRQNAGAGGQGVARAGREGGLRSGAVWFLEFGPREQMMTLLRTLSIPLPGCPVVRPSLCRCNRCHMLQHIVPPHVREVGFSVVCAVSSAHSALLPLCRSQRLALSMPTHACRPDGPHSKAGETCDSGKMLAGVMRTTEDDCANHGRCRIHTGTGRIHGTSALGLGSPLPHLRRDWGSPRHICAGTGAYRCEHRGIRLLL